MSHVVWAEEFKNGLGFEIGPRYNDVPATSQCVQLDWLSIVDWAYASIFAVEIRFHIRGQFWIPEPKLHGACILDFFEKSKNELGWTFLMFLVILAKYLTVLQY